MAATFGSPVVGGAARGRAAAVRVPPALARSRSRSPAATATGGAHRVRRQRRRCSRCPTLHAAGRRGARRATSSLGAVDRGRLGLASRALVYAIEDAFEKLPIHWMWWPAIGARRGRRRRLLRAAHARRRLRQHRAASLSGRARRPARWSCSCVLKFVSWSIALGSGTSGGTLAPLFTIGGGARRAARDARRRGCCPPLGVDPRDRRAGRHGGDVRRRLARAARVGRVRVRDHAPAARAAAAARRLHRGVPRLVRC